MKKLIRLLLVAMVSCGFSGIPQEDLNNQYQPEPIDRKIHRDNWSITMPYAYRIEYHGYPLEFIAATKDNQEIVLFLKQAYDGNLNEYSLYQIEHMNKSLFITISSSGESNGVKCSHLQGRTPDMFISRYDFIKDGFGYSFVCGSIHYEDFAWNCARMFDTLHVN